MAISTYPITLKEGSNYATATKVVDIKNFPDLGGAPDQLETTTLSDAARTYIAGIKDQQALEFTANYNPTDFETVNNLDTETTFWLEFGEGGDSGVFTWKGTAMAYVTGAGVNEIVEMTIVSTPSTPVTVYEGA
ncbi:MAG: hypothetical protein BWY15_02476 [Firmicutes bacterium ADurb.Bin193]|nr:MAG: hypothetical protein BWY15_02476 [Firmicutes bacterium ADurb.Bin193]